MLCWFRLSHAAPRCHAMLCYITHRRFWAVGAGSETSCMHSLASYSNAVCLLLISHTETQSHAYSACTECRQECVNAAEMQAIHVSKTFNCLLHDFKPDGQACMYLKATAAECKANPTCCIGPGRLSDSSSACTLDKLLKVFVKSAAE